MPACREEIARHARLADELRLPAFQWYAPLWAATEATLAGRFAEAERLRRRGARGGRARRRRQRRAVRRDGRGALRTSSGSSSTAPTSRFLAGQGRQLAGRARPTQVLPHLDPRRARADGRGAPAPRPRGCAASRRSTPTGSPRRPRPPRRSSCSATRARGSALRPARALRRPPGDRPAARSSSYGAVDRQLGGLAARARPPRRRDPPPARRDRARRRARLRGLAAALRRRPPRRARRPARGRRRRRGAGARDPGARRLTALRPAPLRDYTACPRSLPAPGFPTAPSSITPATAARSRSSSRAIPRCCSSTAGSGARRSRRSCAA